MKRLLALVLSVMMVLGVCSFAASADGTLTPAEGTANFSIYRLTTAPTLDGKVSAGEYYVLAGNDDYATEAKSKKAIYAGYDDEYLYIAAQVECKGHVNSWYQTANGVSAEEGTDIFLGHCLSLGLTYENPLTGDEIANYVAAGDISWNAAYDSFCARLAHFALTDNYYRYRAAYSYDSLTWDALTYDSFFNLKGSDYQLSCVHWSPRGNGDGPEYAYTDVGTNGTIRYSTPYLAEGSPDNGDGRKDTPYSQKLFAVGHNGYMGQNIHDGICTYDEATGVYKYAEGSEYAPEKWGNEELNTTEGIDTYEVMIPWKWLDYRVSDKRKDQLSDKNQYDYDTYSALNTRQQQLQLGTRTTDGSMWYTFNTENGGKHANAATEACDKAVDGTYFGIYTNLVTGGDATSIKPISEYAESTDYYKAWCEYYESFYKNNLAEDITLGNAQYDLAGYKAVFLAGSAPATAVASEDNVIASNGEGSKDVTTTTADPNATTTTKADDTTTTTAGDGTTANSGNTTTKAGATTTAKGQTGSATTTGGKSSETGDATLTLALLAVLAGAAVTVLAVKKQRI